jgi:hypothetical protein
LSLVTLGLYTVFALDDSPSEEGDPARDTALRLAGEAAEEGAWLGVTGSF